MVAFPVPVAASGGNKDLFSPSSVQVHFSKPVPCPCCKAKQPTKDSDFDKIQSSAHLLPF